MNIIWESKTSHTIRQMVIGNNEWRNEETIFYHSLSIVIIIIIIYEATIFKDLLIYFCNCTRLFHSQFSIDDELFMQMLSQQLLCFWCECMYTHQTKWDHIFSDDYYCANDCPHSIIDIFYITTIIIPI